MLTRLVVEDYMDITSKKIVAGILEAAKVFSR